MLWPAWCRGPPPTVMAEREPPPDWPVVLVQGVLSSWRGRVVRSLAGDGCISVAASTPKTRAPRAGDPERPCPPGVVAGGRRVPTVRMIGRRLLVHRVSPRWASRRSLPGRRRCGAVLVQGLLPSRKAQGWWGAVPLGGRFLVHELLPQPSPVRFAWYRAGGWWRHPVQVQRVLPLAAPRGEQLRPARPWCGGRRSSRWRWLASMVPGLLSQPAAWRGPARR